MDGIIALKKIESAKGQAGGIAELGLDGKVPASELPDIPAAPLTATTTLTAAGWSNLSQKVNVTGVTADNLVSVCPAAESYSEYLSCLVRAKAQETGKLTFVCDTAPTNDLTVNVVIWG